MFSRQVSIIPLDAASEPANGGENPAAFEVLVAVGADGSFEIKEDDGTGASVDEVKRIRTPITYTQATGTLEVGLTQGPSPLDTLDWGFRFLGVHNIKNLKVSLNGMEQKTSSEKGQNGTLIKLGKLSTKAKITVAIGKDPQLEFPDAATMLFPFINSAQLRFKLKEEIWAILTAKVSKNIQISRLHTLDIDLHLLNAILEYLY